MSTHTTPEDREQFVEVFRSNATNVSATCKAFGISRKTFYEWYNTDDTFHDAIDEAREEIKDFGESQLLTLMKGIAKKDGNGKVIGWTQRPDTAAIIFFNKTRNKDRGYVERIDLRTPPMGADIDMNKLTPEERRDLYALLDKADPNGEGS